MAAHSNTSASQIDKTSFWWTGLCAICHVGGGPSEFDRDGDLYYDAATDMMGYQARGETDAAQEFDGDYSEVSNQTGAETHPAAWNKTGTLEADCLYCHRVTRNVDLATSKNFNWIFRAGTLRGKGGLVDSSGADVPAFAAAPTAAQGWATVALAAGVSPPKADTVDIDYSLGVADGSLIADATTGELRINAVEIQESASDWSCWGCHVIADDKKRGRTWFDPNEDVHYGGFNNVTAASTQAELDAAKLSSAACAMCHPVTGTLDNPLEHNFAKGQANLGTARDDTDYYGMNTCRDCHLPGPNKDPNAPEPSNMVHTANAGHDKMSCEFCHIPQKNDDASLAIDNATTGSTIGYSTMAFLSADPLNPADPDKTAWFPHAGVKTDKDGVDRLFPDKLLQSIWMGDWDDKTGDGPTADDALSAIFLWKVRAVISGTPLTATDDNGDGKPEVNTTAEILAYLTAFDAAVDVHGNPVAQKAVFVKGGTVYYLDGGGAVATFDIHASGINAESDHPFSISHNVLPLSRGLTLGATGCTECHTFGQPVLAPVFDRMILVDPSDTTAESGAGAGDGALPIYSTLRQLLPASFVPDTP